MDFEIEKDGSINLEGTAYELKILREYIRKAERRGYAEAVMMYDDGLSPFRITCKADPNERF